MPDLDLTYLTPRKLTVQRNTVNSVMLFWEPARMIEPIRAYEVYRDNSLLTTVIQRVYTDNNVKIGGTYQYKVRGIAADGRLTPFSNIVKIYITESPGIIYWAKANQYSGYVRGTDVSKYTPELDWRRIVNDGIKFAYVRAGGTKLYTGYDPDIMAARHTVGIKSVGLPVGFYFIPLWSSQDYDINKAKTEAKKYADHIIGLMNQAGYNNYGDLMPLLDIEPALSDVETGLVPNQIVSWARAFCDEFKLYTGRTIMIYTNRSFWEDWGVTSEINTVKNLPLMNAEYYEFNNYLYHTDTPVNFGGWKGWNIWQYTQTAVIGGYTRMDASWCRNLDLVMPPSSPRNLTGYNISSMTVKLAWFKNREIDIIGYNIYKDGRFIAQTKDDFYFDRTGLQVGSTYRYMVQAVDMYYDVSPAVPINIYIWN
jgi:lysozyme